MQPNIEAFVLKAMGASAIISEQNIQSLWSGYGSIKRLTLQGGELNSVIIKHINPPKNVNHPRGWNTDQSHARKLESYNVETYWYEHYNSLLTLGSRLPKCFATEQMGEEQVILLEDLDVVGFPIRKEKLTIEEVKLCLKWLANFHAQFMGVEPEGLWKIGTYWHLATRPDEFKAINHHALKTSAAALDQKLNNCKYKTLVHGDAKVANFCFSVDGESVAAVDFQYVGGGCGIKDVVYLLGSCLSDKECEQHETLLLDYYFRELEITLSKTNNYLNFKNIHLEWESLYAVAWTDFTRFLMGWMPTHQKINAYSLKLMKQAINKS